MSIVVTGVVLFYNNVCVYANVSNNIIIEVQLTDCSLYVVDFMCTFSADTISESLPVRVKEKY